MHDYWLIGKWLTQKSGAKSVTLINSTALISLMPRFFFKENVRYPVWSCRDPISLILGTR